MTAENEDVAKSEKEGYDSNDPEKVNDRKAASGRREKRIKDAYRALSSHQQGRELLWDLLSKCGVHTTSFRESTQTMAFLEGQRNIGLYLEARLTKAAPENYFTMIKEHAND